MKKDGLRSKEKHEKSIDHRHYRSGWLLPGRAAACPGLRGARADPAGEQLQYQPHRSPVQRSAQPERGKPTPALRRRGGVGQPDRADLQHPPGGGVPPGGAEPRAGELRPAGIHRGRDRAGDDAHPGGDPQERGGGAVLPGIFQRDVRQRAAAAERGDAVPAAEPVCRGEGVRLSG